MDIINWSKQHKQKSVLSQKVSYIDTEKEKDAILIIHGFGSSSYDFRKLLDELKEDYRVIIPDLIGFGLSTKPTNYYFSLVNQAEVLYNLLESLKIKNVSIIAQGFGSSVMCELLNLIKTNSDSIKLKSVFFLNFSLSIETSLNYEQQQNFTNMLTSIFLKFSSSYGLYKKYILKSFVNQNLISEAELKTSWDLLKHKDGLKTFNFASYWSVEIQNSSHRWLEVIKDFDEPPYLVFGKESEFNSFFDIEKLLMIEQTFLLEDCGYFSTIEKPREVAEIIKKIVPSCADSIEIYDIA